MKTRPFRTSTDATFVLATIAPSNHIPGSSVNVENQIRISCGAALGAKDRSAGQRARRDSAETRGNSTAGRQPVSARTRRASRLMAHAKASTGRGLRQSRKAGRMRGQSIEVERTSLAREARPGGPSLLDWLITGAVTWTMTGLFIDAHEHLFETVETFLNPWHVTMYTGAVFAAAVLAVATARCNRRPHETFWPGAIPSGYRYPSVAGVAGLIGGGALDFALACRFRIRASVGSSAQSASPAFALTGLFFLAVGPVRSALARPPGVAARRSSCRCCCLWALAFEVIQFVMQIAFYPEALQRDRPLSQVVFHDEQFVLSVFLFYKQALEIAIVIWQSALLAAAVLYLCARTRAEVRCARWIVCVATKKLWIGGELSSDAFELLLLLLASVVAGLAGDAIVSKLKPSLQNPNAFRLLGFAVPRSVLRGLFYLPRFRCSAARGGTRAFSLARSPWRGS